MYQVLDLLNDQIRRIGEVNFLEVIEYTSTSHDSWFCTDCTKVVPVVKVFRHERHIDTMLQWRCARMKSAYKRILLVCIVCWLVSLPVFPQVQTLELNRGFFTITEMWSDPLHQSLRWTHVGLLAAGEILYLANAVTGIGSLSKDQPGLTPQDLQVRIKDIYG